jgi:hypothetical protein
MALFQQAGCSTSWAAIDDQAVEETTKKGLTMRKIKIIPKHTGGVVQPLYPTETRGKFDGNPQKGMEGAALTRENGPVDPAAAGKLAQKIKQERAERIRTQGHA